jgi:hypothetical protein
MSSGGRKSFPGDPLALFVHTGEEYLSAKNAKTLVELEELAEDNPDAPVQRPRPTRAGGPGGSGEWTFEVRGTGFEGTFRLAVQPDND